MINWDFIKSDLEATNKDFAGALESGNEVMISGEYYAIAAESDLADYILKALKLQAINVYY